MYAARLRSEAHKHYNTRPVLRPVLRGIFWNAPNVLSMSSAAGDGRTYHTYKYLRTQVHHMREARPNNIIMLATIALLLKLLLVWF